MLIWNIYKIASCNWNQVRPELLCNNALKQCIVVFCALIEGKWLQGKRTCHVASGFQWLYFTASSNLKARTPLFQLYKLTSKRQRYHARQKRYQNFFILKNWFSSRTEPNFLNSPRTLTGMCLTSLAKRERRERKKMVSSLQSRNLWLEDDTDKAYEIAEAIVH